MSFPETRPTLIQRIVAEDQESDWRQFLNDYWGPVCRFAAQRGSLSLADAEDVASNTFQALLTNRLLARWIDNRSAKLRTLLCAVTRNVMSNRARVEQGRARLLRDHLERGGELGGLDAPVEQVDAFYTAWVEDLVEQAVERLLAECHQQAKGDYFRVLYGRICDAMPMPQIAELLDLKITSAENYYKAARKRLAAILQDLVQDHVGRYAPGEDGQSDSTQEWQALGAYLTEHGGLEEAVRKAYVNSEVRRQRKPEQIDLTLSRIREAHGAA